MRKKPKIDIIKTPIHLGFDTLRNLINESVNTFGDDYFIKDVKYKEVKDSIVVIIMYSALECFRDDFKNSITRASNSSKHIETQDDALDQSTDMIKRVFTKENTNAN